MPFYASYFSEEKKFDCKTLYDLLSCEFYKCVGTMVYHIAVYGTVYETSAEDLANFDVLVMFPALPVRCKLRNTFVDG